MDFKDQSDIILSQVEMQVERLEQAVLRFEQATLEAEHVFDEVEGRSLNDETMQRLQQYLLDAQIALEGVQEAHQELDITLAEGDFVLEEHLAEQFLDPWPAGQLVFGERYRLLRLIYRRPRLNLYLARRVERVGRGVQPLVVIRELILGDLDAMTRQQLVQAAFEEFAAPRLLGSPHVAGVADHVYVEKGRHYLVMQPRPARGKNPSAALTLAEFLGRWQEGANWLKMSTALQWGIELCRTVNHLHRMKNVLGEITPEMVLVDPKANASWSPILLAAWPPAPLFWSSDIQAADSLCRQIFPSLDAAGAANPSPFIAPEVLTGQRTERSDVYSLGALLYLLFTHHMPSSASQRLLAEQKRRSPGWRRGSKRHAHAPEQGRALIAPHLLNEQISMLLEQILLRALALKPEERFASAQDLAEVLAGLNLRASMPTEALPPARVSRLRRLLLRLKKE